MKRTAVIIFAILSTGALGWWFSTSLGEREKPIIRLTDNLNSLGREKKVTLSFADMKTGLKRVMVTLNQDNKDHILLKEELREKIKSKEYSIIIAPKGLNLHEGPATLIVSAVDNSLWKNETIITRPTHIDFTPPAIYLYTSINNINAGGTCVVAFGTSEPSIKTGIMVNDNFSPGYPGTFSGKPATIVFFGLPIDAGEKIPTIRLIAYDGAENEASFALPIHIRKKKFRHDQMQLTDNFLQQKMGEFQQLPTEVKGKSPLEIFLYINGKLREENEAMLRLMSLKSVGKQLWEGPFMRMKEASPMALFGDKRTYFYQKKAVAESIHMGVDLASVANAPVAAGNNGIVVYAANLGIYGNTVVLDHGMGLFSVYGHLSEITTKKGTSVKKGEIIGKTGMTGLAGGDHLHFGMLAGGEFVNPLEWWDPHWIEDNVTSKLNP